MEHKDGGPAFPDPGRAQSVKQRDLLGNPGMTLRDYFAAKALPLIDSRDETSVSEVRKALGLDPHDEYQWQTHWPMYLAQQSYVIADAMLKARAALTQ